MRSTLRYAIISIALFSCQPTEQTPPPRKYVDVAGLDPMTKPGDNFFRYVNGIWYDTVKIADDQVGIGSYAFLNIPQRKLLQQLLEEAAGADNPPGTIAQQVGDFYASGMDTTLINRRGYEPVQPLLGDIATITDIPALMAHVADQVKANNQSIISIQFSPDNENSSINIAHFSQSGLGLPDRDYYFKTDIETAAVQEAYKEYLATLFQLTGADRETAVSDAGRVYNLEKQLAESHKTRIQRRIIKENFHNLAVAEIARKQPNIGWTALLKNLGVDSDTIDLRQPDYFDKLNAMLKSISIDDWKLYLRAHTLVTYSPILSRSFEKAAFEYEKALTGQSTEKARSEIVASAVDQDMGFALGQLYVKKYFPEEAKQRALELVNNFQKSFEHRIDQLDWMSDSTKVKAKEKLFAITKKIGYPDKWRQYDVTIDRKKYFENVVSLGKDEYQYQLGKLGNPPYKDEWVTSPPTVTAYYQASFNQIVFPAGILQYPYFDVNADDAINYGGIGMVIGHEMTHAFDDQGAQYDKDGNVKNWWTKEDYAKFKAKTQQIIDLYNTFTVLDTVHVKGALTVGENTADNGAIAIAYDAFKLTPQGQDTTRIDGFTPDQRFFLSVARIWRVKTRDEFMRNYINTNPHSPAMWRVNGPLMNSTHFYDAFNVQPGEKNYKAEHERIVIW